MYRTIIRLAHQLGLVGGVHHENDVPCRINDGFPDRTAIIQLFAVGVGRRQRAYLSCRWSKDDRDFLIGHTEFQAEWQWLAKLFSQPYFLDVGNEGSLALRD